MSPADRRRLWLLGGLVAAMRWLLRPSVPDDYDSFGFVLGMAERFDLSIFQPQFPGYPIFVVLGRGLGALGFSGLGAAALISSIGSGVTAAALGLCAGRLAGVRAAYAMTSLHAFAWGPMLLGSSALSESLGMAFVAGAFAAQLHERVPLAGLLAGLLLGVRASYFPLLLPMAVIAFLDKPRRSSFAAALGLGLMAWAIPFALWIGSPQLFLLGRVHLFGHFARWGGSVATRPDLVSRAAAFARGLCFDEIVPSVWALGALAACVVFAMIALPKPSGLRGVLASLAPYALWVFFGQNIVEQPRHLLPLAEGLLLITACLLAARPLLWATAAVLLCVVDLPLALERKRVLPASAQAANWLAQQPDSARTLIAAGRSARFFRAFSGAALVQEHAALGDLAVSLARIDPWPARILATSEVDLSSAQPPFRWRAIAGPTFCRDARIDRARPCLTLTQLVWNP